MDRPIPRRFGVENFDVGGDLDEVAAVSLCGTALLTAQVYFDIASRALGIVFAIQDCMRTSNSSSPRFEFLSEESCTSIGEALRNVVKSPIGQRLREQAAKTHLSQLVLNDLMAN